MRIKNLDLIVIGIIVASNMIFALLPNHIPILGIVLALPVTIILPGYALTEVLFYKRTLDFAYRLLLSLGLSLAIDILSGLILNILPSGLRAIPWAVFLGLLTLLFSLLAAFFRWRVKGNGRREPLRLNLSIQDGILCGLAFTIAIASISFAYVGAARQPHPGFTQFWMFPSEQTGKSCAVRLGINSFESTPVTYRVAITINGSEVASWASIVLTPQQQWNRLVPITTITTGNVLVDGRLYRLDKPGIIYREAHATISSCPTSLMTPTAYSSSGSIYEIMKGGGR
jgi:uncharacterized membrane protein